MTTSFTVSTEEGILRLEWNPGTRIEYADAVEAALALFTVQDEECMPLLVRMVGVRSVSSEARMAMNAYRAYSKVALVGDNPMGAVLAAFSRRSPTPTRYFTSERAAIVWLLRRSTPRKPS